MSAREPPLHTLPTGTVTFLFTDIEGSTELLQRVGDQPYKGLLEQHHRLMRESFEPRGGREVDTQGDAFFVAFPDATGAIAAAVAAQHAMGLHSWPEGVKIRVRMGMHTGEPTLGPGGYVGIDVHRAARICSAGYGQQILISERTFSQAEAALPDGVALRDLGEHRLKDLARPEHLFQVIIPGLPAEFPPLKSLDIRTTNLPSIELTSFVGREREMAAVKQQLSTSRLVTLMGPGGAGKTRLALQVAADLFETFPKGVWLAELAPLSDPSLVTQTVATVLGVREVSGRPLLETLIDYLRTRDLLILLDNCEHLIEATAQLAGALLRGCSKLRLLATSREALRTAGEATFRVPSLVSPDPRRVTSVEELMQADATRLFLERAALSNPRFVVTEANAPAVAQICRCLDGIPLAIELAAARVKVLPVEQIARRLDDRFRLLTSGFRTSLPHHQTLRAAVDWSYDLLSEGEKVLFRRLAVFPGGFLLEAAEAVCAGDGLSVEDVLDLVSRLVDKSLLITEAVDGDIRYRILETIRHYSRGRLVDSGEADTIRDRHLRWYQDLAGRAAPELQGADQLVWLERLEQEHDNLRAALEWAREDRIDAGLQLAGALYRFWGLRGFLSEGREWLEGLLAKGQGASTGARANAAYGAGLLAFAQGDYDRAEVASSESLRWYHQIGDTPGMVLSLNTLGIVARNRGEYQKARVLLDESLTLSRQSGHTWALAEALNILGVTARRQGDRESATAMFEESLARWRVLADKWGLASSLGHLGVVARLQGDYERARALHEESLALRRQLGDKQYIAAALSSLGIVARHLGDYEQAGALFDESLVLSRELGDKLSIAATLCTLGLVVHRQGDDDRAAALLRESLALSREQGDKLNYAAALCNLGFVTARQGDIEQAAALHNESLDLFRELGNTPGIADCLLGRAIVAMAKGQPESVACLLGAAEAVCRGRASLPPSDQAEHDRAIEAVRALLSDDAFAAAWARGQAMSPEEAIEEALR